MSKCIRTFKAEVVVDGGVDPLTPFPSHRPSASIIKLKRKTSSSITKILSSAPTSTQHPRRPILDLKLKLRHMYSPFQIFRNLTPPKRLAVGLAFLAWGTAGLYLSDSAEKKLGLEPSEQERDRLKEVVPRLVVVDREGRN